MKIKTINNWQELLDVLESTNFHTKDYMGRTLQFRGQSNFDWNLTSSLQRIVSGDEYSESKALYYETQARKEFLSQAHLAGRHEQDEAPQSYQVLVDMQHHSCPTRLIDWSGSPYVALYFAVRENLDCNGALYLWNTANYLQNMRSANRDYTLVGFDELLNYNVYDFVHLIFATKRNERLVRQQGCFSISNNILKDHCEIINEAAIGKEISAGIMKLEIPSKVKLEFLARLKTMNITANSLFPGLDGLGKSIEEALILRKWAKR